MQATEHLQRLVKMLGGWPRHFKAAEKKHGLSLLAYLRRDRLIDEAVFGLVVRYASLRSEWEALDSAVKKERADAAKTAADASDPDNDRSSSGGLSLREQAYFAYHNKLVQIENLLLGTPYQRAKAGISTQTSFLDQLEEAPKEQGGEGKVMPFQKLTRKT